MNSIGITMPGSKRLLPLSPATVLDEPWTTPEGHENATKKQVRALLPSDYPEDLSRDSSPATGSLGLVKAPMLKNRTAPFKGLRKGR